MRTYSSADEAAGLLGRGWQLGYEARVAPKPGGDGAVVLTAEDGTRSTYTRKDDGSFAAPPGVRSTLKARPGGGWELTTPTQRTLAFDADGRLLSILNERGKGVTLRYNAAGVLASATDAGGRAVTFTSTAPGRVTGVKLPDGRTVTYSYRNDRLDRVRDPDGAVTVYGYDVAGRLTTVTDALGHVQLTNTYDAGTGRVTAQRDHFGKATTFEWDAARQESKVTDPDGVVIWDGFKDNVLHYTQNGHGDTTVHRYDERLNVAVVADPLNRQVELGYDAQGNPTSRSLEGGDPVTETSTYDGANNLLRQVDGLGRAVSFTYNDFHQPVTATDGEGHVTRLAYHDDSGLLKTATDPLGHVTRYEYDGAGNPVATVDPTGARTTRTFDATGRLKSVTDPRGNVAGADPKKYTTTYDVYDGRDRLRRITDPLGHFRLTEYDNAGRMVAAVDGNNHHTTYVYDDGNRLTRIIDADLRVTSHGYTPGSRLASITDGVGNVTRYTYETAGRLSTEIAPKGSAPGADPSQFTTTYGYDRNGNLISASHPFPEGGIAVMRYTYDARDALTTITDPLGNTTRYGYDNAGNITSVTDPLGHTTRSEYDGNNQVTRVVDPRDNAITFAYDAAGNLVARTTATGARTTYGYDAANRRTTATLPRGNVDGANPDEFTIRFGYDVAGNHISVTDPLGNVSKVEVDAANRVTRRIDPNGNATRLAYDRANRLVRILGPDATNDTQATVNNYDHVGHLIDRTDPLGHVVRYTYDAAGRLASSVDPIGNRREFTYDPNGNIATIVTARGTSSGSAAGRAAGTIVHRYDNLDRLRQRAPGTGRAQAYGYDASGRLTSLADPDGEQVRGYDAAGRLRSVTRDGRAFRYEYDAAGNMTSRTLPDGSTETLGYDGDNRPTSLRTALGDTAYEYDPNGNLTLATLPGGSTHRRTYDRANRLATLAVRGPAEQLSAYTVTRDKVGNPVRLDTSAPDARSDAFGYDRANRLTAICYATTTCAGAKSKLSFGYDLVGNRVTRTRTGANPFTEQYLYNAADQLTARYGGPDGTVTYDYDADGNTVRAAATKTTYDLFDQVTSVDDGKRKTVYTDDAAGNRRHADTTGGGSTTRTSYEWDVNNPLPMLVSESTGGERRSYTYHADGSPLSQQVGGSSSLLHPDPFGNVATVTATGGAVQQRYALTDPFGELTPRISGGGGSRLASTASTPIRCLARSTCGPVTTPRRPGASGPRIR